MQALENLIPPPVVIIGAMRTTKGPTPPKWSWALELPLLGSNQDSPDPEARAPSTHLRQVVDLSEQAAGVCRLPNHACRGPPGPIGYTFGYTCLRCPARGSVAPTLRLWRGASATGRPVGELGRWRPRHRFPLPSWAYSARYCPPVATRSTPRSKCQSKGHSVAGSITNAPA